ncbi:sigma-54-dependent Fis family transcriptional regulator [Desulfogranum japonicum]|uniref:sigma-54-dependent Fis family transcriptional regulator n=1 Tax=Desulfogranum japonicum TaxID=231447 RepID=UPI001376FABB|nr:sigma-54-dependent Fis family transcriptional regulator [Desulfogranum japonicum]
METELDKTVWRRFVNGQKNSQEYIKASVTESWERCLQMGVDPGLKKCKDFREEQSLDAEHRFLRDVVKNSSHELSAYLKEKGLLFTISDRYGYLTGTVGSLHALRQADSIYFGPGASWTEQSVGTNAIGTALTNGLPLRVIGTEHFCESHHGWMCSAAPIFGADGLLHGCVDISGPVQFDHSRSLALAVYYARAIEALLFQRQCMGMIGKVLNNNAIGLLTLDSYGKVCYANNAAADLFHTSIHKLSGHDASKWFDLAPFMDLQSDETLSDPENLVELRCLFNPTWSVYAAPLTNSFHHLHGLTLCIYPPIQARPHKKQIYAREGAEDAFSAMIGGSDSFTRLLKKARRVAATDTTVLITGPSGTGKEVMARSLHKASPREKKPFVAVNCGAIAADLIQSELFGYAEGAFTGARRGGQAGKFEQAAGGTLFLDEIGEMPLAIQVNLLRVLDEKEIIRVGGKKPVPVDVRVIAATNRDMEAMVEEGRFRQDLYYRLHVVPITLPPLCEREDDVQLLADYFINEFAQKLERQIDGVDPAFRQALAAYSWPGNIRELRHVIESTMILMEEDVLCLQALPENIQQAAGCPQIAEKHHATHFASLNMDDIQKQALQQALDEYEGNISQMAKALGIGRNTTYAKLKKYNLM